jgi:hypothetical protein
MGNNCPDHIKFQWKIKIAKSTKSLNIPEKDRKNRHEKTKIPNNLENEICITKLKKKSDKNQSQPIKSKTTRQTSAKETKVTGAIQPIIHLLIPKPTSNQPVNQV